MKFLKSTLSIVALFAIGSMDARVRQSVKTAPVTIPKPQEKVIVVKQPNKPNVEREIEQYAINYINKGASAENSIMNYVLVSNDNYDSQTASERLDIMFENIARNFPNTDKESMKKTLRNVFSEFTSALNSRERILKDVNDSLAHAIK